MQDRIRRPLLAALLAGLFIVLALRTAGAEPLVFPATADRVPLATPVAEMPPLMRDAYIAALHEELAAHGYTPWRSLGQVIREYQEDAGLPVDGVATRELLDHLKFALPKVFATVPAAPESRGAASGPPTDLLEDLEAARNEAGSPTTPDGSPPRPLSTGLGARPFIPAGEEITQPQGKLVFRD